MGFLFDDQRRMIRKDGSLVENAQKGRSRGRRTTVAAEGAVGPAGRRRVSHLRVDAILGGPGPLREEYERLVEKPGVFLKDLQGVVRGAGASRQPHVHQPAPASVPLGVSHAA
jgi:hypothetical protein